MKHEEMEAKMIAHDLESLAFKKQKQEKEEEAQFYFSLAFKIRMHLYKEEAKTHEEN